FLQLNGPTAVMNTYLKIALLATCLIAGGLLAFSFRIYEASRHLKPLVIRINEVGRAEAAPYESLEYKPQEAEMKYFLIQFVQQHYGRMRATLQENFARSLYFLDGRLADDIMEKSKKAKTIESFLSGQSEEIDVRVNNVAIEDLRRPPYRATVD